MLTWWDGASWTDRRTPIPGGPLDPKTTSSSRETDDDVPPGELGDDEARPHESSGPIPVIESEAGGDADAGHDEPVFPDPTSVFAPVTTDEPDGEYPREDDRSRPRLLLILLPLFFIGLAAAALIATSGDDDGGSTNDDTSDELTTIGEAVQVAERAGLPIELAGSTIGSLIDDICGAAGDDDADATLALRISTLPVQSDQVHDLLNSLGKGAAVRCPDDVASDSGLLLRTGELAIERLGPAATSTTSLTTDTTEVAAPPTTATTSVTPTTRRPTTTTSRAPTTTAAPTTTVTSAPPPCNPNYSGCLNRSGDYDCIGKTGDPDWQPGDGPNFVSGPITVTGSDVFDLDLDGNGIGCERTPQT